MKRVTKRLSFVLIALFLLASAPIAQAGPIDENQIQQVQKAVQADLNPEKNQKQSAEDNKKSDSTKPVQADKRPNSVMDQMQKDMFGDSLNQEDDNGGYMNRLLAQAVTAFPRWCITKLGLKDLNQLIFNQNSMKYGTFPSKVWEAAGTFYQIIVDASAYLMVIAVLVWGIIILFRSGLPAAQGSFREFIRGILIYAAGITFGGYLFELVFTVNGLLVTWAMDAMNQYHLDVTQMNLLDMILSIQNTNSLGQAILFFVIVLMVGVINYQYAIRMITLIILILLFPVCAYASIFPGSQKSLDTWFREFMAQVFMNGGHALAFALFFVLMKNDASVWYLFALLFGLPGLSGLVRIIFGAPGGGHAGGGMGMGSMMAVSQIMKGIQGGKGKSVPRKPAGGAVPGGSAPIVHPAVMATKAPAMAGKFLAGAAAMTAGAMIGGALTGSPAGVSAGITGMRLAGGAARGVKKYAQDQLSPYTGQLKNKIFPKPQPVPPAPSTTKVPYGPGLPPVQGPATPPVHGPALPPGFSAPSSPSSTGTQGPSGSQGHPSTPVTTGTSGGNPGRPPRHSGSGNGAPRSSRYTGPGHYPSAPSNRGNQSTQRSSGNHRQTPRGIPSGSNPPQNRPPANRNGTPHKPVQQPTFILGNPQKPAP